MNLHEISRKRCVFTRNAAFFRLMALEGAIEGVRKTDLPDAVRTDLKAFYQEHKL